MASLTQLLEDIENSPEGPEVAAIFDFDGTLIAGYSAVAFIREQLRRGPSLPKPAHSGDTSVLTVQLLT